jgi:hypothetical protein
LSECLDDILEFTKHKNPNVKLETMRFLLRCLRTTRDAPSKPEQKQIADTSVKLLADTSAPMRDCAAEVMGTLMKIIGERAMNPYMDGLDDIRKTKIKEYFDSAQVKAKEKPKPVAPPKAPHKKLGSKPGAKAPAKKAAPSPDEFASAAPKAPSQAPRAIPSKLAPKGTAPPGGLKLKRPGAPATGSLPSPKRPAPQKAPSPIDDEPVAASAPRLGLGRGLAGRALSKPSEPAPQPQVDPGLSAVDRAELEELRTERERWEKQTAADKAEKGKLLQDISDLQLHNAQLIEEHTRDNLAIRAKEAQLVRARSDADAAQEEVAKQKREIERLKRELQRSVRPSSPAPTDISEHIMNGYNPRDTAMSRSSNRLSYASTTISSAEEKENGGPGGHGVDRAGALSPSYRSESGRSSAMGSDGVESWKRAAEVTSQLKLRIEVGCTCLFHVVSARSANNV